MTLVVTVAEPDEDEVLKRLGTFVASAVPGLKFVRGQVNRVPEPRESNFVEAWPISMPRLATNLNEFEDAAFVARIDGDVMTVVSFGEPGAIVPGAEVFGPGVVPGTRIVEKLEDAGGGLVNGAPIDEFVTNAPAVYARYVVTPSQTLGPAYLSAGRQSVTQTAEAVVQMDVHGPDSMANAATLATLFRDEYAVDLFAAFGADVSPLHADDPRQIPFKNAETQYETRFVVEAHMQVNQRVVISQQFADALVVSLINAADFSV